MRKILLISLFFVSVLAFKHAYCEDNLLAVDVSYSKEEKALPAEKSVQKNEDSNKTAQAQEEPLPNDDSDKELGKMKAYREILGNKQKELEMIKLDLEKSSLLLKKKEAEKEIYRIDSALPASAREDTSMGDLTRDAKEQGVDSSEMRIQLLVISDNLREAQISLKGVSYSLKEGDSILPKLTVEWIEPSGVTLRQPDGTVLKLNFVN